MAGILLYQKQPKVKIDLGPGPLNSLIELLMFNYSGRSHLDKKDAKNRMKNIFTILSYDFLIIDNLPLIRLIYTKPYSKIATVYLLREPPDHKFFNLVYRASLG